MCRCNICDNELTEQEIQFGEDKKLEPCTSCLEIIMDAAYCDGFEPYPDEAGTEISDPDTISLDNLET